MEKRIAVISIIVEDLSSSAFVNDLLHKFASIIVGRMGIPIRERSISIISLVVDGEMDKISDLSGKLGRISNVTVKTSYAKVN